MKLVSDCRGVWKHYSSISMMTSMALVAAWNFFPADLKAHLPPWVLERGAPVLLGVLALGFVGKFIDQGPLGAVPKSMNPFEEPAP